MFFKVPVLKKSNADYFAAKEFNKEPHALFILQGAVNIC